MEIKKIAGYFFLLIFLMAGRLTYFAWAQISGESTFEQNCSGCHTIGGGNRVGPDLKEVTARREREWLIRYSRQAAEMKAVGDPIGKELAQNWGATMPNINISEAESAAIVDFLGDQSKKEPKGPTPAQQESLPFGDANRGKKLYTGVIPFAKGGVACLACHQAAGIGALGGGTLGADLTQFYSKYGDLGVSSVLSAVPLPFPTMQPVYANQPLTLEEVMHLKAFFQKIATGEPPRKVTMDVSLLGLGGAGMLLLATQVIWRKRLQGVRRWLLNNPPKG